MMEDTNRAAKATAIENLSLIPIAQLTPLLTAASSRTIKAVVTLTWPYSSATGAVAFLLSEPDFRLRRTRGQVRVQFSGSSAKSVAKAGIASGDEILLCLDGAECVHDEAATVSTPGRGIEFELKFTERLALKFRPEGSHETTHVEIDHPAADLEPAPARIPTPEPLRSPSLPARNFSIEPDFSVKTMDEWSSPAFIKRARTSYGSLFELNYDPFDYDPFAEEDGTIPGKGRKKTRLSSSWRYTSRSPTPEVEDQETGEISEPSLSKPVAVMTDEACQTIGLEEGSAAEALANFSRQVTNVGGNSYAVPNASRPGQMQGLPDEVVVDEAMLLPTTNTLYQESANTSASERSEELPSSPRLQPIPSDSLPLVSPLVPSRIGPRDEATGLIPAQGNDISIRPPILSQISLAVDGEENLYGASPTHQHEEQIDGEFSGLRDPALAINGAQSSNLRGNFNPEDQHGQCESINTQMEHSEVPYLDVEQHYDRVPPHQIYAEEAENPDYQSDISEFHNHEQNFSQYPELDDELPAQERSSWAYRPSEVPYPELPHTELEREVSYPAVGPQSMAMSRSQSARSEAIDLTEDGDEEQPQPAEQSLHSDGDVDNSVEGEEGKEEEEEEEEEGEILYPGDYGGDEDNKHSASELEYQKQISEAGDSSYDEDGYEDYPEDDRVPLPDDEEGVSMARDYDSDEEDSQQDEDCEEESYDEEFDEDEEIPVRREPEVIDLLSSDDEEEPPISKVPADVARHTQPSVHSPVESEEMDEDEDEEMIDPRAPSEETDPDRGSLDSGSEEDRSISGDEDDEQDGIMQPTNTDTPDAKSIPRIASVGDDQLIAEIEQESESAGEEGSKFGIETTEKLPITSSKQSSTSQQQNPPPAQSSLFARMFNLDGANDDPIEAELRSTIFSGKHKTQPASITETPSAVENGNAQLPTPDDTQITEKIISANQSFDSVSSTHFQMEISKEASTNEDPTSAASEPPVGQFELQTRLEVVEEKVETSGEAVMNIEMEDVDLLAGITEKLAEAHPVLIESDEEIQPVSLPPAVPAAPRNDMSTLETFQATLEEPGEMIICSSPPPAVPDVPIEFMAKSAELKMPPPQDQDDLLERAERSGEDQRPELTKTAQDENDEPNLRDSSVDLVSVPRDVTISEEPAFSADSPRRSTRRPKPIPHAANQKENVRPVTPVKARPSIDVNNGTKEAESPIVVIDARATPKGHDASIELALDSSDSPTKPAYDLRKPPVVDKKLMLSRALRTEQDLSQYTSLKVIRYHLNQKLDVLAIATTTPPEPKRAKGGPRHYQITFNITDPSIAPSVVTEVQVFRPYQEALPTVKAGDGILLRNFLATSVKGRGFGLKSTQDEGSSWAVFKDEEEPEVRGPPVEYRESEKRHIAGLKSWYVDLDATAIAKINRANGDKGTVTGTSPSMSKVVR